MKSSGAVDTSWITASADTYSFAAAEVMLPHIIGSLWAMMHGEMTTWPSIIEHTELMVCFGGIPLKKRLLAMERAALGHETPGSLL